MIFLIGRTISFLFTEDVVGRQGEVESSVTASAE